jgi:protein SCO1/2
MTMRSVASRTFRTLLMVGAGAALMGCSPRADTTVAAPATAASASVTAANDGASLFAFDQPLTDQDGRTIALRDLGGHVLVASMVYASCTSICPRVTSDMQAIERTLADADRPDVRFVLLSLDPTRDTPEAWRRFSLEHHLDNSRWRLLSPTEDGVRDLAAILGVKYAPEANGEIAHSAIIVVLDRLGVVVHRQVGLGQSPTDIAAAITRARG